MGCLVFVLGKSLELIANLKGKKVIIQKEKKQSENWDEKEEEKGSEVSEVHFTDDIVVEDMDNITQWDVVMELNKMTIHKLVYELLNLPSSLTTRFEIECSRLQLGACLYNFKSIDDCIHGCDVQSDVSTEPLAEDEYDDNDNDETSWFSGFMSSNDDADDYFYSSSELETDEDESSDDDDDDDDDDSDNNSDNNDDHCKSEVDVPNTLEIDRDFDSTNVVGMDVESTLDGDNQGIQIADSDEYTLPSIFVGDVSGSSTTSSGECVPVNIHRDKYEAFGNDPCYDSVSSSENSADAMATSDISRMTEH